MLPFLRKKNSAPPEHAEPAAKPPSPPPAPSSPYNERPKPTRGTTPGVQMLKEVWHIDTVKKKKEMAPPGVSTDIYSVPKQRQMPPRHTGGSS
jgi:hypothetical protein